MIVKRGKVFTPATWCGILKGVTRRLVIETAKALGYPCEEGVISRHEVYTADEAFLTRTSSGIMPVTRCDKRLIGNGRPGPVTRALMKSFQKQIETASFCRVL